MTTPKVWGKHFWYTIHVTALGFPDEPTDEDRATYKTFYTIFGKILPCRKCASNYEKHLKELPIDDATRNKDRLFAWTVELHNIVNQAAHKPIWNANYAEAFYLNGDYDKCHKLGSQSSPVWKYLLICMIVLNLIIVLFTAHKVLS